MNFVSEAFLRIKKIVFVIPFLLSFAWFCFQLGPVLSNTDRIFSLELKVLFQLLFLILSLLLSSLFFIIFAAFASDFKIVLPIALIASISSVFLVNSPQSPILAIGFFLSFVLVFLFLSQTLKSYITFSSTKLLGPKVKTLTTLFILVISMAFYLSSKTEIAQKGFTIPDSLIDSTLKMIPMPEIPTDLEKETAPNQQTSKNSSSQSAPQAIPQVSKEQIEILRQNPDLLKQYGLDPSVLDELESSGMVKGTSTSIEKTTNPIKSLVQSQLQTMIKPYLEFIPIILAVLFFFTLRAFISLLSIPLPAVLWFIFYILEKSGFTSYTKETREVKKLII